MINEADTGGAVLVMNKPHHYSMFVKSSRKNKHKKTNENSDKKVFKDLEKLAAKFSNCLLKQEQDFIS